MSRNTRVCLIGFGEVGQIVAADLLARDVTAISAWDVQFAAPTSVPSRAMVGARVRQAQDAGDAVVGAQLVISSVTASQTIAAASSVAPHLVRGAHFLDLNSVSASVRERAAEVIEAAGGRYVEAAVMSPIQPRGVASPMLLGGRHAAAWLPLLHDLGFAGARFFDERIGRASTVKMCRGVIVKGMEALLAESLLAARRHGVENAVLESLRDWLPTQNWPALARYMISRSIEHGRRRAEEMREVARTIADAGLDPWMSEAAAQRQDWAAQFGESLRHEQLGPMLDSVLAAALDGKETTPEVSPEIPPEIQPEIALSDEQLEPMLDSVLAAALQSRETS